MSEKKCVQFEIDDDCFFADGAAEWLSEIWELFKKVPTDRLRELAAAEREGRVVVLPCKVGDPIWDIRYGEVRKHFAYQWHVVTGRPEQCFLSCEGWYCGLLDFGVTVFLTREAAEAALAGKEDETHE